MARVYCFEFEVRRGCEDIATPGGLEKMFRHAGRASPSEVFESFFAVLDDGLLSGAPVLLAATGHRAGDAGAPHLPARRTRAHCRRRRPADWEESPFGDTTRLRGHIDQAAAELAVAMSSDRR
jgi:FMN reductase